MKKSILMLPCAVLFFTCTFAQLTGVKTIPGDYPTISAAVADLNSAGAGAGGVTFNIAAGFTESITSPILITETGTASNPVVFQKNGAGANPLITRTDAGTVTTTVLGGQGDAVIIIEGSDYITFEGISITVSSSSIEYGYYIRKASATDGCKNVIIKNAAVTMTKGSSQFVTGIYSSNNDVGSLPGSATGITVTSTGGRNENITFVADTISNVFAGIVVRGFAAASPYSFYDQNNVIGRNGAGNIIQNFGGNSASTTYGVYLIYQNGDSVQYNTINNTAGSGSGATAILYGIFSTNGTTSNFTAGNNTITLTTAATASALYGIFTTLITGTLTVYSNTVSLLTAITTSGLLGYIYNNAAAAAINIKNNIIAGTTVTTSGNVYFIYNTQSSSGISSVSGNSTSGNWVRDASVSGIIQFYYNLGSPTGIDSVFENTFSDITQGGSGLMGGIYLNTAASHTQNFFNNTLTNLTNGTGTMLGIYATPANSKSIHNNQLSSFTSSGLIYGAYLIGTGDFYSNKIYDFNSGASGIAVHGIDVFNGALVKLYNNIIGDLKAPVSVNNNAIAGIYVTAGTAVKAYYNTIYLNAVSSGPTFGTSGIYANTSTDVELINNMVINNSTAAGTGNFTAAYRRSSATLTSYSNASNNNLFYAGTPGPVNVIFYDGTNSDQTLTDYQTRVTARDNNSISEFPAFESTTGSDSVYLHLSTSVANGAAAAGIPVSAIINDFDGNLRDAVNPDMGADELVPGALPVSLLSFNAKQNGGVNNIYWSTSNEINTRSFVIERSNNANNFTRVGEVAAAGNSNTLRNYTFADNSYLSGVNYYRLKIIDLDNHVKFSYIKSVKNVPDINLAIYPNPAAGVIKIDVIADKVDKGFLTITNVTGKQVYAASINVAAGNNTFNLNISSFPTGVYIIKINLRGNAMQVKKFTRL